MVGHAKRRQQFGQRARSGPLVIGQHLHRLAGTGQFPVAGNSHHPDGRVDRLFQIRQKIMVGVQIQRRDAPGFAGGQRVESQCQATGKGGAAGNRHFEWPDGFGLQVGQAKRAHHRHRVLNRGIAGRGIGLDVDPDFFFNRGCGCRRHRAVHGQGFVVQITHQYSTFRGIFDGANAPNSGQPTGGKDATIMRRVVG